MIREGGVLSSSQEKFRGLGSRRRLAGCEKKTAVGNNALIIFKAMDMLADCVLLTLILLHYMCAADTAEQEASQNLALPAARCGGSSGCASCVSMGNTLHCADHQWCQLPSHHRSHQI